MQKTQRSVRTTTSKPVLFTLLSSVTLFAMLHGCNGSSVGGDNLDAAGPGGSTVDMTGGGSGGDMAGQAGYCAGSGPPIAVGDSSGTVTKCSGQVAASAFRYGLCLCQGLASGSPITIDAFDSTAPGSTTLGNGGSAGVNSNVNVSNKLSVGGMLQVTGALTLNELTVGSDLLLSDTLSGNGNVTIGKNAGIGGDVKCNGALKVTGTLTYPAGRTLSAGSQMIGQIARAPVTVTPPCDCAPASIYDIAGYVTARATSNDNASASLDPGRLTNFSGNQTLDLPCGRFYLDRIGGQGKVTLNITGRTALFVGGDINLSDAFTVNLGPSGELDLFVNGGLTSSAPLNFGNRNAPARVRLYMGGSRNINLSAGSVLGGNVYAPNSALVTSGTLEVFGALFVGSFNPSAQVLIHHDVAIIKASQQCTPSGSGGSGGGSTMCTKCQDCGGQACKAGSCGSCTQHADCCAPLLCNPRNNTCEVYAG